ncbi:MAG: single-stranded-DNA-specific exonuclease RecJ, partial [Armatimonadetes bacterium]|nr:single-stranded-DNA-specific exonuclease RecJ [Armatimonadota bacterium]
MHRRWIDPPLPSPEAEELAHRVGVARLTGQLLWERGARDEDAARRFLDPNLDCLHDPLLLPDADRAVERLARAVRERERILVHGDYDVDGVCAAALLTRTLRVLQADVDHFVPHRRVQGYDLQVETVRERAAQGIRLIVTADCGIVAFAGAEAARDLGVDLIVTDHHEPDGGGRLPVACAVVNPKRPGSRYPFPDLCGTAVAYKLCLALLDRLQVPSAGFRTRFLDLVALATCADCMPLLDENRVLVKHGLESIRNTNKAGLKALMQNSGLRADRLNTRALGFALGPRINAIGRMDDAAVALELLLTSDAAEAENLAQRLEQANRDRQQEQEQIYQDAIRQSQRYLDDRILVLSSPRWHPGIIGIVASRVVENCFRPAVLIAVDEATGRARGSCRSLG